MAPRMFKKTKELSFERTYEAPADLVWRAWTDPELLTRWWGPDKTEVTDCEIDLRVGGEIRIVMEAGEAMGKYKGTRWPMVGTFTTVEPGSRLVYDARSWTEGEEDTTTIEHTNEVTISSKGSATVVRLEVTITHVGPKAKMAAFGMKWGYKAQLGKLEELLASHTTR